MWWKSRLAALGEDPTGHVHDRSAIFIRLSDTLADHTTYCQMIFTAARFRLAAVIALRTKEAVTMAHPDSERALEEIRLKLHKRAVRRFPIDSKQAAVLFTVALGICWLLWRVLR